MLAKSFTETLTEICVLNIYDINKLCRVKKRISRQKRLTTSLSSRFKFQLIGLICHSAFTTEQKR